MNKQTIFLLLLCGLLLGACGKDKTGIGCSPYNKLNNQLHGNILQVKEQHLNDDKITYDAITVYDDQGRIQTISEKTYNRRWKGKGRRRNEIVDSVSQVRQFIYDADNGLLKEIETPGYAYSVDFDMKGNIVRENYEPSVIEPAGPGYYCEYMYDESGRITQQVQCSAGQQPYVFNFSYQENGALQGYTLTDSLGLRMECECDSMGNVIRLCRYDKKGRTVKEENYSYVYDDQDNWFLKLVDSKKGVLTVARREYTYASMATVSSADSREEAIRLSRATMDESYIESVRERIDNFSRFTSVGTNSTLLLILGILIAILYLISQSIVILGFYGKDGCSNHHSFAFLGEPDSKTGMRRLWVYNHQPYSFVGYSFTALLLSFLVAIFLMFLVGAAIYGILWAVYIILWGVVIIGGLALLGGVLAIFFSDEGKGPGCLAVIIGGIIAYFYEAILGWGKSLTEWGQTFFQRVNLMDWTWDFFKYYWDVILLIIAVPVVAFLAIALLIILISLIFMGVEALVMRRYRLKMSCPHCGSTKFTYLINGQEHPVGLHPGVYGILHQTRYHKTDKEWASGYEYRVPTMIFNGKGELTRRCTECKEIYNRENDDLVGTDIHIGVVGHRSNGKSYMLYKGLGLLMKEVGKAAEQIDADRDTGIMENFDRIQTGDLPSTDSKKRYKAIQLMLTEAGRLYPYHLYFYDVAGEKFKVDEKRDDNAMDFYKNVQTIVFVIDPLMTDISEYDVNEKLAEWIKQHAKSEQYDVDKAFEMLKEYLQSVKRKPKDIDLIITCTKSDQGYFSQMDISDTDATSDEVEAFLRQGMGLNNLLNNATRLFGTVRYAAISALCQDDKLLDFMHQILEQRGVNTKKIKRP